MRIAVIVVLALAGFAVGVDSASSLSVHQCVQKDELWFRAADGTKLVGHRFGGKKPAARTAVVLAHMSEGELCVWAAYARRLAAKGFFVLAFDFRGHGFSGGFEDHSRAPADVVAAVRAVRSLGARKVVVAGASLGGIAAIVAAPRIHPPIQGVVSVSGPAAIAGELNARPVVSRLRVPTLYLAAEQDQSGSYDFAAEAQELHAATGTREKAIELVPGALHGTFLVDGSSRVRIVLERFLRAPAASVP
jgi:alpha-beta hydrolase superfamily lysophospholipase